MGFKKTLSSIYGMYAFALKDHKNNKFYLVRDKVGEKPLYYSKQKMKLFSSEIKAICDLKDIKKINLNQLGNYFKYNYLASPYTIYENIFKLNPGSLIEIDGVTFNTKEYKYFDIKKTVISKNNQKLDFNDIIKSADNLIDKIIAEQSIADVNLGSFLSGGEIHLVSAYLQKIHLKKFCF